MKLLRWSFDRKNRIRGYFDKFPNSTIYFRRIKRYYCVYSLDWNEEDPMVTMEDREEMQQLLNKEIGRLTAYENRKSREHL